MVKWFNNKMKSVKDWSQKTARSPLVRNWFYISDPSNPVDSDKEDYVLSRLGPHPNMLEKYYNNIATQADEYLREQKELADIGEFDVAGKLDNLSDKARLAALLGAI